MGIKEVRVVLRGLGHKTDVSHNPMFLFPERTLELAQRTCHLDF